MNLEDDFMRYVPRCCECGEYFLPSDGPANYAELRFVGPDGCVSPGLSFHALCAPAPCRPGHVTTIDGPEVLRYREQVKRWVATADGRDPCPTTPALEARIANWPPYAQQIAREEWAREQASIPTAPRSVPTEFPTT